MSCPPCLFAWFLLMQAHCHMGLTTLFYIKTPNKSKKYFLFLFILPYFCSFVKRRISAGKKISTFSSPKILVYFSPEVWYTIIVMVPRRTVRRDPGTAFGADAAAHHISKTRRRETLGEGGPSPTGDAGPGGEGAHVLARFWRTYAPLSTYLSTLSD